MNAEELFARFFSPLYPPDARSADDLARARVTDANPGKNQFIALHLDDAAQRFAQSSRQIFGTDGASLKLDGTDASVHRLSAALTHERRDAWAADGDAGTPENALFNAVIHGAAYVGSCIVAEHGGIWGVRRPLWESVVRLRSRAGEADLAIFHWWLKSLANDGQGTTLADRYRSHVEVPCAKPEELQVIVGQERPLPRLTKPRYDTLHKYLRAHLPELRDLGAHFPSPERFDDFGLRWVDFLVLGGGRMVLMAAAAQEGIHLFWLSAAGFEKSAFFVCDAFPDPVVRPREDRVVVLFREKGQARENEMLWWGP